MASNQVELLSRQYSVSPDLVRQLFHQHKSVDAVHSELASERYLYDDGQYSASDGRRRQGPRPDLFPSHRNGVLGGHPEQRHHMPMSTGIFQENLHYPVDATGLGHPARILRTTSDYPDPRVSTPAEILARQQSVPVTTSYGRMPFGPQRPDVNTSPTGIKDAWGAGQGVRSHQPLSGAAAVGQNRRLYGIPASVHGGLSSDAEPSPGSNDDAYTRALMKHQEARLERIKKEVDRARQLLHDMEQENIVKRQSHTMFGQNKNRYPTENEIERRIAETESLREHVQQLRDNQQPVVDQQWECSYCTFHNHPSMTTKCEVCEMPRRQVITH